MLTIRDIAVDLDSHVRYGPTGKSAEQIAYQVNTINRALEEIRVLCPQELRATAEIVWTPGAPVTTAVSGSSLGPAAALANYAAGCSLMVDGDASFNALTTAGDGSTAATLLFPYSGTAGSHVVTIYGDCVKLAATVDHVIGCELLHERRPLQVLNTRSEWLAFQRLNGYRDYDYGINTVTPYIIRVPGVPRGIWVETCVNGNVIEYRAHCAPLPNDTFRATLEVATMAADITASDLAGGGNFVTVSGAITPDVTGVYAFIGLDANGAPKYSLATPSGTWTISFDAVNLDPPSWVLSNASPPANGWFLSGAVLTGAYSGFGAISGTATVAAPSTTASTTRPVPGQRVYGILRALCMWHWSGSPWFRNDAARKVIEQEYLNATQQAQAIRPTSSGSVRSIVVY